MAKNKSKIKKPYKKAGLSRRTKVILAVFVVALIVAASAVAYAHYSTKKPTPAPTVSPTNTVNYNPPTAQQKAADEAQKDQIIQNDVKNSNTGGANSSPTVSTDLSVTITRYGQTAAGQPLSVRTLVNGTTTGTCTADFSQTGQTSISQNFPVVFQATTASCDGMDIPASDFPTSGNWQMTITVSNGTKISEPVTQTVEVTK